MDQDTQLNYLLEQKLALLVSMNTKKLEAEVAQLKTAMIQLHSELETLKSNVKNIRVEQVSIQPQMHPAVAPRAAPVAEETHSAPAQVSNDAVAKAPANESVSFRMARSGNYKSEDVSVEKFFYYGNKK